MIELIFQGNGNALTGPFHNDIGAIEYNVGGLQFNRTGWFDYHAFDAGGSIAPDTSLVDSLFNSADQLIGSVLVNNSTQTNGTAGAFYFYPEAFVTPHLDQVYVSNLGLYSGPPSVPCSVVPETSTWMMLLIGFSMLAYAAMRRGRAVRCKF